MKKQSALVASLCHSVRTVSHFCLAVSFVFLSLSAVVLSQELAATLTGTVTDTTGAVVAGATVSVHSIETGADVRVVTTSGTGNFNITNIPAGRYTVTVNNPGFETFVAKDVVLDVAEKHTLDVQLKAGNTTERVEVIAENTTIQTTTAEQSGTITAEQLTGLALNNRNFEQLVLLQPGVANQLGDEPGFGLDSNTQISVNGARTGANNWTVDGADINDSGSNGTLLNTPSVDAIQEFTLQRSNYDASFGRSGGGQVVVATKSGTNQIHGSAYEFNRNNYYNANTFENRQTIDTSGYISNNAPPGTGTPNGTPIERYNDFGFTVGGPVIIPKLYHPVRNKTFFFESEEWRKASTPGSTEIPVPTNGQLAGVFPWTFDTKTKLYDNPVGVFSPNLPAGCVTSTAPGLTSASAQTSTINLTSGCASQNALAYLKEIMLPFPANSGSNQLVESYSQLNNFRQDIVRIDQNIGDRVRIFGRFMQDSVPENFPFGLWGTANYPGADPIALNAPGRNVVGNVTANISPRVVNEVEYADSWGAINATLSGAAISPSFTSQLTGKTQYQDPYGRAPNVTFANSVYTGLSNGDAPYFERNIDHNLFDNLSIQRGNHTIRLGATAMWMTKTENASAGLASFTFDSANGNDAFANFLLGQAANYSQADKDTIPDLHYTNFEAYVQDDWKVTRNLTLNLGIRYSYFPSPSDSNHLLVNFDPAAFTPGVVTIGASGNMNPTGPVANSATYANGMIFPKGATCSAAQAIYAAAVCSPYGSRVNSDTNNNWGPRFGLAWDPQGNGKMSIRAGYGLFFDRTLNGIWEQNEFGTYPFNADPPLVQTAATISPSEKVNLFDDSAAGAAPGPSLSPINPVMTGTPTATGVVFKAPSYQDYNASIQREIVPNTVFQLAYIGTKGTHLLGDVDLNQPTVAARTANELVDVNAIRPFAGYGAFGDRSTVFTSNYNSLQASLDRRLSHGLTLGIAYTWSKLLTTNPVDRAWGATDTYDLRRDYGPSTLNTPQIFVLNYLYQEPFFKNQRGLGLVLGGWEISGIVNVQTGQSITVTQSLDPFDPGTGNPNAPGAGNRGLGFLQGDATNLANQSGSASGPKTVNEYFNTAAFSQSVGAFGNSHTGVVQGPGFQRWDTSLFKNIRFGERAALQLRLETFNTFNHGSPSQICNDSGSSTCVVGTPAFGVVTAYHIPRNVQIGAKVNF